MGFFDGDIGPCPYWTGLCHRHPGDAPALAVVRVGGACDVMRRGTSSVFYFWSFVILAIFLILNLTVAFITEGFSKLASARKYENVANKIQRQIYLVNREIDAPNAKNKGWCWKIWQMLRRLGNRIKIIFGCSRVNRLQILLKHMEVHRLMLVNERPQLLGMLHLRPDCRCHCPVAVAVADSVALLLLSLMLFLRLMPGAVAVAVAVAAADAVALTLLPSLMLRLWLWRRLWLPLLLSLSLWLWLLLWPMLLPRLCSLWLLRWLMLLMQVSQLFGSLLWLCHSMSSRMLWVNESPSHCACAMHVHSVSPDKPILISRDQLIDIIPVATYNQFGDRYLNGIWQSIYHSYYLSGLQDEIGAIKGEQVSPCKALAEMRTGHSA